MEVKTNILLSVILGDFPVIESPEEFHKWEKEYQEFLKVLPCVEKKGASQEELRSLNNAIRVDAVFNACPEMGKLSGHLASARKVINKHYAKGNLDQNYFEYCKNLIELTDKTAGSFHYYDESEAH